MNILICWEDTYCLELKNVVSRIRNVAGQKFVEYPNVYHRPVEGYGNFKNFVKRDWPKAREKGILNPRSHGPIDFLICVADADCADKCCSGLERPLDSSETQTWVADANQRWTEELRQQTPVDPGRVFGRFLRWNKESVVVACFDQPDVLTKLAPRRDWQQGDVDNFLSQCSPDPRMIAGNQFVDVYRRPARCLTELREALGCDGPAKKNDPTVEDALRAFSISPSLALCERMPDLVSLVQFIYSLSGIGSV